MKIIAKVISQRRYDNVGKNGTNIYVSIIDNAVPAIIYHPDRHEAAPGECHQVPGLYPVGATIEIEATFHQAGEIIHEHTLTRDCYMYSVKIVD